LHPRRAAAEGWLQEWSLPRACAIAEPDSTSADLARRRSRRARRAALEALSAHEEVPEELDIDEPSQSRFGGGGGAVRGGEQQQQQQQPQLRQLFAGVAHLEVCCGAAADDLERVREQCRLAVGRMLKGHERRRRRVEHMRVFNAWKQGAAESMLGRVKQESHFLSNQGFNPRRSAALASLEGMSGKRSKDAKMLEVLRMISLWHIYASASRRNLGVAEDAVLWTVTRWDGTVMLARVFRSWRLEAASRAGVPIHVTAREAVQELEAKLAAAQMSVRDVRLQMEHTEEKNDLLRQGIGEASRICRQRAGEPPGAADVPPSALPDAPVPEPARALHEQQRNRLIDDLRDTACALAHAILVLDDVQELERLLASRAAHWRRVHGGLRPSLQQERQQAAHARQLASEECTTLEGTVRSLLEGFGQAEHACEADADRAAAAQLLQGVAAMRGQLERAVATEASTRSDVNQEIAQLKAECSRLSMDLSSARECSALGAGRTSFVFGSELTAEREQQRLLFEQLQEERDKVVFLESEHRTMLEEGAQKLGQRAQLGAIARQVDRLTRDRQEVLQSTLWQPAAPALPSSIRSPMATKLPFSDMGSVDTRVSLTNANPNLLGGARNAWAELPAPSAKQDWLGSSAAGFSTGDWHRGAVAVPLGVSALVTSPAGTAMTGGFHRSAGPERLKLRSSAAGISLTESPSSLRLRSSAPGLATTDSHGGPAAFGQLPGGSAVLDQLHGLASSAWRQTLAASSQPSLSSYSAPLAR